MINFYNGCVRKLSNVLNHILKFKRLYILVLIYLIAVYFSLPRKLFSSDYSTVIFDRDLELIGSRVSKKEQWRFPEDSIIPHKFKICLINFEDKHFYIHSGVNPISIIRSGVKNIRYWKIKSGGSTLSMQVIRMSRPYKTRSLLEKIIEIFLSFRLELSYSKNEILSLYSNNAPFGGNVIGINAASWRYFGRNSENLSWAEAAMLAVLPNSPSLIHPGKNRTALLDKRNHLLKKLFNNNIITNDIYSLAILEPIPGSPLPFPDLIPHITAKSISKNNSRKIITSIKKSLQENLNRIIGDYYIQLKINNIKNAAAVIIDVNTGNALAYTGNIPVQYGIIDGQQVDCVQASRSTGSILKPFLFMGMQQDGLILPGTLVPDIPTRISGFKPENYDAGYDGAVPARKALARSLNIPAVRMLQTFGVAKFQNLLQKGGLTTLTYSPDHYGLTLILGGAEGKLWEISSLYASFARELNNYWKPQKNYSQINFENTTGIGPGAIFLTFEALLEVNRPDEEVGWNNLASSRRIAWKTGTSFGFRDGWAIGSTPEYVVGVWVGNSDGEGRPGITGIGAAAPLLFRIFNSLPATSWFHKPFDDLEHVKVCRLSGYKAGPFCDETDSISIARAGLKTGLCPYHQLIHLDKNSQFRVNSHCLSTDMINHVHWFILPPAMELYFKKRNIFYKTLPPFMAGCDDDSELPVMELIYPSETLKILVPREIDGTPGKTIFEIAHRNSNAILYWYIDNELIATTQSIHQVALSPGSGRHLLSVVDQDGRFLKRWFEIIARK